MVDWEPKVARKQNNRVYVWCRNTKKQGRVFVYTPLVEENEYVSQQSNSFLNRFYDGDFSAMLSAYLENNQLSETELNNLRSILSKNSK